MSAALSKVTLRLEQSWSLKRTLDLGQTVKCLAPEWPQTLVCVGLVDWRTPAFDCHFLENAGLVQDEWQTMMMSQMWQLKVRLYCQRMTRNSLK